MLHLVLGTDRQAGTDLLTETICRRAEAGIGHQIFIVPEQYSFDTERLLCSRGGDKISRFAEVLSFTRLASRVFSLYGGVSEEFLDEGGRLLTLYLAAERVKTQIKYYAASLLRPEFLLQLGTLLEEFMTCCITPEQLTQAAGRMQAQQAQKLTELALLYESYLSVCKTGRADPVTRQVRLAEILAREDYCAGKRFYFDGFTDFTAVQLRILELLLPQAEEVQVFLCTDGSSRAACATGSQTARTLEKLAARRNVPVQRTQLAPTTARPKALTFWLSHLLDADASALEESAPALTLVPAETCAKAAQAAAGIIQTLTQKGARWRQIAIAVTAPAYESALRPMLARAGIGAYYAGNVDILQKPMLQAVLAAMQAASRFSYEDVMQYLKSGYAPLTQEACDRVEKYAYFWGIRGAQWLTDWTRHPDGYGHALDEAAQETLSCLNLWREGAIAPLRALHSAWGASRTVSARVHALCDFLEQTHFPETACEQTNELYEQGNLQLAQEQEQLYEILMTAIEQLELVLGAQELELERFLQLFRMLLGQYQVGSIPATLDQVLVGELAAMRNLRAEHLIVLGADEGSFPAFSQEEGLLLDSERQKLLALGIALSPSSEARLGRELAWTQLALQSAGSSVWLISGSEQPSYLLERTQKLLPQCRVLSPQALPFYPDNAALAAACLREKRQPAAASPILLQLTQELSQKCAYGFSPLSRASVQSLYGSALQLSASRLDRFAGCRYAFFLRDGLKLAPWRQASFDAPAFGTFAHYVLECTVREVMAQGGFHDVAEEQVLSIAAQHIEHYTQRYLSELDAQEGRTPYLFQRNREELLSVVRNVAQELRQTQFQPCDVELAFSKDGALPPVYIQTPDGQAVLSGFVDRVDICHTAGADYFRVIDYKTGHKDFDYTDLLCGQGLQMLLYLFAIARSQRAHPAAGRRPAGVLYVPGRYDMARLEPGQGEAELTRLREKSAQYQGLVLDDAQVLQAMEPGETPKYLPVQCKRGERTGDLASSEQFRLLERFIAQSLRTMTGEIFSGAVTPNPVIRGPMVSSCQYCEYQTACHKDLCRVQPRYLKKIGAEEFWAELQRREQNG